MSHLLKGLLKTVTFHNILDCVKSKTREGYR